MTKSVARLRVKETSSVKSVLMQATMPLCLLLFSIVFLSLSAPLSSAAVSGVIKQLTSFEAGEIPPYYSLTADGRFLFFVSSGNLTGRNPNLYGQIFRVNIATGVTIQISSFADNAGAYELKVSGNGSRLVFRRATENWSTYVMNSNGTGLRRVSHIARWFTEYPRISYDGCKITYFAHEWYGSNSADLYTVKDDGTQRQKILSSWGGSIYELSGNGSKIFSRNW